MHPSSPRRVRRAAPAHQAKPGRTILLSLLLVACGALTLRHIASTRAAAQTNALSHSALARLSVQPTVQAAGRGKPYVNLSDGHAVLTTYAGDVAAVAALQQRQVTPTALASADFDEDGVPDLVSGYATADSGIVTRTRGNVDAIYPHAPAAQQRKAAGTYTAAPFLAPAQVFAVPAAADFVGAGDFDADGHFDVVTAARGGDCLYLLRGDGRGEFAPAEVVALPGGVTALTVGEINRADGLADVVVGVAATKGAQVLIFEGPAGALQAEPEVLTAAGRVSAFALGQLDDSYEMDLAVGAGSELLLVRGRDRKLSLDATRQQSVQPARIEARTFASPVLSLAAGDFGGQPAALALLTGDGRVAVVSGATDAGDRRGAARTLGAWARREITAESGAAHLIAAKLSSRAGDALLVAGADGELRLLPGTANNEPAQSLAFVTDSAPAAVLPMRLNGDALADLVVLQAGQVAPSVIPTAPAQVFVVNTTNDANDGACNAQHCSLKEAINAANANPGADTINFNIPGTAPFVIASNTGLPALGGTVTVDATTQPGYAGVPLVVLDGSNLPDNTAVLFVNGSANVVRGLSLVKGQFSDGMHIANGGGNTVEANYFGLLPDGTVASTRFGNIAIVFSPNNTIGGTTAAARNVISSLTGGVTLQGTASSGNFIRGNYIGTNPAGTAALGNNPANLFHIALNQAPANNVIGGTVAGARNILSGAGAAFNTTAIEARTGDGNLVQGNYIGTDVTGNALLRNGGAGVVIGGSNNTVGGTTPAARNVIAGNSFNGVAVHHDFGVGPTPTNNLIQGNYIGVGANGATVIANGSDGVVFTGSGNFIGGTATGAGNVIAGNSGQGIHLSVVGGGSTAPGGSNSVVQGNLIGTSADGNTALPNQYSGIRINSTSRNQIGGTTPAARNVIAGNGSNGIEIYGDPAEGGSGGEAASNKIEGNFIGTNAAGTGRLANGANGIGVTFVGGQNANVIGGPTAASRNIISGNNLSGVAIGIRLTDPNTGAQLPGTGGTGITVQNNYIGVDVSGQNCLGNTLDGIFVDADAQTNTIANNLLACNGRNGVFIPQNANPGVRINLDANTVYHNASLGIDLGAAGITPNDPLDADGGANLQQNFPTLTTVNAPVAPPFADTPAATTLAPQATVTVGGTLQSAPNTTYTVHWYFSSDSQCTNNQQPSQALAFGKLVGVATDAQGNAPFTFPLTFPAGTSVGVVNTTATDPQGNTSEFSACLPVDASAPPPASGSLQFSAATYSVQENAGSAPITVTRTNGTSGAIAVTYATGNGTATAGSDYTTTVGLLNFAAGETSKTFNVSVGDDALDEPDETINLFLSNPTGGATLGAQGTALLTITDDDPAPALSINDVTQAEGNSGTTNFSFTVGLAAASGQTVSVNFATAAGTATSGTDFAAASGTLTFNPGETSKQLQIGVVGDTVVEPDETFFVNLSNVVNATLADGQGQGTITNDDSISAPVIALSTATYSVSEGGGRATLTVTRTGEQTGTATVDYRTQDGDTFTVGCADTVNNQGRAYARCDFATAVGTLEFAPGETTKQVTVPVLDDGRAEGNETFQLQLSNLTSSGGTSPATLGTPATATVTILDNDAAGAQNPIFQTPFFVRMQYLDFLSREPEAGEPWSGVLQRCPNVDNLDPNSPSAGCDRILVSLSFFGSPEFQLKGFYVFRFYKLAFNRLPEYLEIIPDMSFVAGTTPAEVFARKAQLVTLFTGRSEFVTTYGSLPNGQYVNALLSRYQLTQVTTPDPAQPDGTVKVTLTGTELLNRLNAGTLSRAQAFRAIADSDQVNAQEFNNAFVAMQYYGYLRRKPEAAGYQAWLTVLQAGDQRTMVNGFMNSPEYRLRFGQP